MPLLDAEQRGLTALNRLYRCKTGWIVVCVRTETQWRGFTQMLGNPEWLSGDKYSDEAARQANDQFLAEHLEQVFQTDDAEAWEHRGGGGGVPIVSAGSCTFEEFLVEEGLVEEAEHPAFGNYWRLPPRVRFSDSPNRIGTACALGEHTIPILEELGYDPQAIEDFLARGVARLGVSSA
jgi:crotonobetainyl-CoA:carnitine CoA-transferase CaiB-like acyl-CoA transferase